MDPDGDAELYFDSFALEYDQAFQTNPIARLSKARTNMLISTWFDGFARVADLGCGPGTEAMFLADRGHDVIGLDISGEMIGLAQQAAQGRPFDGGSVEFWREDCFDDPERLVASYGRFDGVLLSYGVVNCIPDPEPAFWAARKLLRPHGRLVISTLNPWCAWDLFARLARAELSPRWRDRQEDVYYMERRGLVKYLSARDLRLSAEPSFRFVASRGTSLISPPPFMAAMFRGRDEVLDRLWKADRAVADGWLARTAGDMIWCLFESP